MSYLDKIKKLQKIDVPAGFDRDWHVRYHTAIAKADKDDHRYNLKEGGEKQLDELLKDLSPEEVKSEVEKPKIQEKVEKPKIAAKSQKVEKTLEPVKDEKPEDLPKDGEENPPSEDLKTETTDSSEEKKNNSGE